MQGCMLTHAWVVRPEGSAFALLAPTYAFSCTSTDAFKYFVRIIQINFTGTHSANI